VVFEVEGGITWRDGADKAMEGGACASGQALRLCHPHRTGRRAARCQVARGASPIQTCPQVSLAARQISRRGLRILEVLELRTV
jgi:hypothetical protein